MTKHDESQRQVEAIKVGDTVSTPGVTGVVLAKGQIVDADDTAYAGVKLLTTVQGNEFHPFRSARFYYDDDAGRWQSGSGMSYLAENLLAAVTDFQEWVSA